MQMLHESRVETLFQSAILITLTLLVLTSCDSGTTPDAGNSAYIVDDAAAKDAANPTHISVGTGLIKVDIDNDGLDDIIWTGFNAIYTPIDIMVHHNQGDSGYILKNLSTFIPELSKIIGIGSTLPLSADFNNDGYTDVYFPLSGVDAEPFDGEKNLLLLGSNSGLILAPPNSLPVTKSFTHDADLADIDNDGDIDILEINIARGIGTTILVNDGNAIFTAQPELLPEQITTASPPVEVAFVSGKFADIDNDGWQDIILGNFETNDHGVIILINDQGDFRNSDWIKLRQDLGPYANYGNWNGGENGTLVTSISTLDINGDGLIDVILSQNHKYQFGKTTIHINNSNNTFSDETDLRIPFQSNVDGEGIMTDNDILFEDIDFDGDTDMWFIHQWKLQIWLNDGNGYFSQKDLSRLNEAYESWVNSEESKTDEAGVFHDIFYAPFGDLMFIPLQKENMKLDFLLSQHWCTNAPPFSDGQNCDSIIRSVLFKSR